ncbi:MAG: hypothetical protein DSY42_00020 [Aquifex sp.]|nr:MAG: hypothetical protein DSY42_00020 [Aquifex sp.]
MGREKKGKKVHMQIYIAHDIFFRLKSIPYIKRNKVLELFLQDFTLLLSEIFEDDDRRREIEKEIEKIKNEAEKITDFEEKASKLLYEIFKEELCGRRNEKGEGKDKKIDEEENLEEKIKRKIKW